MITIIFFNSSTGIKLKLNYYSSHKNTEKLVSFIDKNENNEDKESLVLIAIDEVQK
ncbi:hypothetical protein [Clostridium sp. DL1XJH146]